MSYTRSFGIVARHYVRLYLPTLADSTAKEYRRIIDTILMPAFENKGINTITAMQIQALRLDTPGLRTTRCGIPTS
jgi:hypothetical protein